MATIPVDLARALHEAGLGWAPRSGDAFAIPDRDLDGMVFVISEMVVSQVDVPGGPPILAFNGTTEWALDSLETGDALWLPREDQLREALAEAFVSLERIPGPPEGWAVTVAGGGRYVDVEPVAAYARAVLERLSGGPAGR